MAAARYFHPDHKELLKDAAVIAEEVTSDFYKLSAGQWRRAPYDILTLEGLRAEEISPHALALVAKYNGTPQDRVLRSAAFDYYRVCLQDHNILKTMKQSDLNLFPLLLYILTHELVHIVRFSQFLALFEAPEEDKQQEEQQVHYLTRKILAPLKVRDLLPVIQYYDGKVKEVGSMPIYEYQCDACGQVVERWQKFSDAPLSECPACGGSLHKIISSCAFHLKGSGWYVTDYSGKNPATGASDEGAGQSQTDSTPGETKAAAEPAAPAPAPKVK